MQDLRKCGSCEKQVPQTDGIHYIKFGASGDFAGPFCAMCYRRLTGPKSRMAMFREKIEEMVDQMAAYYLDGVYVTRDKTEIWNYQKRKLEPFTGEPGPEHKRPDFNPQEA